MGRTPKAKKATPQSKGSKNKKTASRTGIAPVHCKFCHHPLEKNENALFVEQELSRIFCSEECIASFFASDVDVLEKQYLKMRPKTDLSANERESYTHLKWTTLQEPEEIWKEPTESGDFRYNLISEYNQNNKTVWYICQCLFLNNEPSFLFLGFPTQSEVLVDHYRRGTQMAFEQKNGESVEVPPPSDGLASSWTEDEVMRAEVLKRRRKDDIPSAKFGDYEYCFQETLEKPDEVLTMDSKVERKQRKVFHFIKRYEKLKPSIWYVVIARETSENDQLEVLDAFPTRDGRLIEHMKRSNHTATAEAVAGVDAEVKVVH